jgi:acyl-CoA thioester hydrolase
MLDTQGWFWSVHPIYPHDTDYGGVVSHRAIVQWLEMARIQFAVAAGTSLPELLQQGTDLPVTSLNVTYLQSIPFGTEILLGAQLVQLRAPRLAWGYKIQDTAQRVYVQGRSDHAIVQVTEQGWRPHRRLPELLERCFRPVLVASQAAI